MTWDVVTCNHEGNTCATVDTAPVYEVREIETEKGTPRSTARQLDESLGGDHEKENILLVCKKDPS